MTDNTHRPLVICAAVALIDADNRILIQKRPAGKAHAGRWEFPGGKVEKGESPEAALVREVYEELGVITVEKALFPLSFISYAYPDNHVLIPLFGARNWTGTLTANEGQEWAWVRPVRLRDYDLLESNQMVLGALMQLI